MLMDPGRFTVLSALEDAADEIRAEALTLSRDAFVEWPDCAAYDGTWLTFPLKLRTYPETLHVDLEGNRAMCPRTSAVLAQHPRIFAAGISRMEPGCHVLPHVDLKDHDVLRAHLALKVDEHALMRVADGVHRWTDGKTLIFDALVDHETVNLGSDPRIVLMFDFQLTEDEMAYAQAFNATVDPRFFIPASVKIPLESVAAEAVESDQPATERPSLLARLKRRLRTSDDSP